MKLKIGMIVLLFISLFMAGCAGTAGGYATINATKAQELIDKTPGIIILDIREPWEYNQGHLPNAILMPPNAVIANLDKFDKEATYLLYCLVGARSEQAAKHLAKNGVKKVYNLSGGIQAWTGEVVR